MDESERERERGGAVATVAAPDLELKDNGVDAALVPMDGQNVITQIREEILMVLLVVIPTALSQFIFSIFFGGRTSLFGL